MSNLKVNVAGVDFKNPVITASGCYGFGRDYEDMYPLSALGGVSLKGMTFKERLGNPPPRIAETPSGMLNSVGLQNPGVEHFLANDLPYLEKQDTVLIANIAGSTIEDYCKIAERLSDSSVHMMELNISCPNVKEGGVAFGYQPTVFDECSQYFITVTMKNIPNHAFATGIRITPFWVTLDGTEVEGVSRFIRVEDHYNKIVNVPVRLCDNAEVAAGLIGVRYNADKYDYVGYDNGTVFDSTKCNDYNGTVYCVGNVDDISKNTPADGLFVNLRFQLKENQTNDGSFKITNMDFCQNTEQFVHVSVVEAAYKAVG